MLFLLCISSPSSEADDLKKINKNKTNKMHITAADIIGLDGNPAPFTFVGGKIDISIDDGKCRVTLAHEYLHIGKYPETVLLVSNLEGWELLRWTATSGENRISSGVLPQTKTILNPPGVLSARLPFDLHPLSTLIIKETLYKEVSCADIHNSITIQRSLWGRERGEITDWKKRFQYSPAIAFQRQLSVNCNIKALTDIKNIEIPALKGARINKVDSTGSIAWKSDLQLDEDITLSYDTVRSNDLLQIDIVKAIANDIDSKERFVLSVAIHPTISNLTQLGLDDDDLSITNSEFIFVIDISGSMHQHITSVVEAVTYGVLALPSSALFNIYLFGGDKPERESLSQKPVKNTDENIELALHMLKSISVKETSADILPCLNEVYKADLHRGYTRQVMLYCNSPANSERETLQLVRDHADSSRVIAFGISPGADKLFIDELSRVSGGISHMINTSKITSKTLEVIRDVSKPCLSNVTIDFSLEGAGMEGDVADSLSHIRKCFSAVKVPFINQRQVLHAFTSDQLTGNTTVNLSGLLGEREISVTTHVQPLEAANTKLRVITAKPLDQLTHISAAFQRVRTLVEPSWSWKASKTGQIFCGKTGKAALTQKESEEVIRLSTTFGFVTPLTVITASGKGISESTSILTAEYGYSLPQDVRMLRMTGRLPTKASPYLNKSTDGSLLLADHVPIVKTPTPLKLNILISELVKDIVDEICGPINVDKLFKEQRSDGSWRCTQKTCRLLGVNFRKLRDSSPSKDKLNYWTSCCAMALLQSSASNDVLLPAITHKSGLFMKTSANLSDKAADFIKEHSIHYINQ